MVNVESPHLRLQQQIDCQLEITPRTALESWEKTGWQEEPGTDVDEAPLKYMALVLLDAIEERAVRFSVARPPTSASSSPKKPTNGKRSSGRPTSRPSEFASGGSPPCSPQRRRGLEKPTLRYRDRLLSPFA